MTACNCKCNSKNNCLKKLLQFEIFLLLLLLQFVDGKKKPPEKNPGFRLNCWLQQNVANTLLLLLFRLWPSFAFSHNFFSWLSCNNKNKKRGKKKRKIEIEIIVATSVVYPAHGNFSFYFISFFCFFRFHQDIWKVKPSKSFIRADMPYKKGRVSIKERETKIISIVI